MKRRWSAWPSRLAVLCFVLGSGWAAQEPAVPDAAERGRWFADAKFGVFFHWGVYSVVGEGEQLMQQRRMPADEYEKLLARFNPEKFDARQWVSLAKRAGAQYIVACAKHHDGFCMFDSGETEFDIAATPFGRDVIGELTQECRSQDLRICFYYSTLDWHHPDYVPRPVWQAEGGPRDLSKYLQYMRKQLRELCTNYGTVDAIWYDVPEHIGKEAPDALADIDAMIRELQPGILINDHGFGVGDFRNLAQMLPAAVLPAEAAVVPLWQSLIAITTGQGSFPPIAWLGYDKHETVFEPVDYLIRTLVDVTSKGGNLVLAVGPRADGTIQPELTERLDAIGRWMFQNKRAIYETAANPFKYLPYFGRVTVQNDQLYAIVFDWPGEGELRLSGLTSLSKSARLLVGGNALSITSSGQDVLITGLPATPPDPIASVIVVDLAGPPRVEPTVLKPDGAGHLDLPALYGFLHGASGQPARFASHERRVYLANWIRKQDYLVWEFETMSATTYRVAIEYACEDGQAGSKLEFAVGDRTLTATVSASGGLQQYAWREIGEWELPAGKHTLTVKATDIAKSMVANFRGVRLQGRIN